MEQSPGELGRPNAQEHARGSECEVVQAGDPTGRKALQELQQAAIGQQGEENPHETAVDVCKAHGHRRACIRQDVLGAPSKARALDLPLRDQGQDGQGHDARPGAEADGRLDDLTGPVVARVHFAPVCCFDPTL
jgi:hypothetical protein